MVRHKPNTPPAAHTEHTSAPTVGYETTALTCSHTAAIKLQRCLLDGPFIICPFAARPLPGPLKMFTGINFASSFEQDNGMIEIRPEGCLRTFRKRLMHWRMHFSEMLSLCKGQRVGMRHLCAQSLCEAVRRPAESRSADNGLTFH